jgi:peroxiredoxin
MEQARWKSRVLWAAGLYNLAFSVLGITFPLLTFELAGLPVPNYPEQVQVLWLLIGAFGIGYLIAASDPNRHWAVLLIGSLTKLLAPFFMLQQIFLGKLPWTAGLMVIPNDIIWWIPFAVILRGAYQCHTDGRRCVSPEIMRMALRAKTQNGMPLVELSRRGPMILVFLRHFGCTFCREALADVARQRASIEAQGVGIALIHMSDEAEAGPVFQKYGLADLHRVSDPKRCAYRAFGLGKGSLESVFGPKVWWRGARAAIIDGHGLSKPNADPFQMPGVFVVFHGQVLRSYRHQSVADRPDYLKLAVGSGLPEFEAQV